MASKQEVERNLPTIYYENLIMRRESFNQWMEYWGVVRGKWLQFYKKKSDQRIDLIKTLELTKFTLCSIVKRTNNRFPFSIDTGAGTYYMKCDTEVMRYHWIFSILTAAMEKPKKSLPSEIPEGMLEEEAFQKDTKKFKKRPPFSKPKDKKTEKPDPSRRRQRYAKRAEDRLKKKRARKLGIPLNKEESSCENSPVKTANGVNLRRTKKITFDLPENARRYKSLDNLNDEKLSTSSKALRPRSCMIADNRPQQHTKRPTSALYNENNLKGISHTIEVEAIVHHAPPAHPSVENQAFEGDECIEAFPKVLVSLHDDDGLLPNVSDSDSELYISTAKSSLNCPSTAESSLNSYSSTSMRFPTTDPHIKTSDNIVSTNDKNQQNDELASSLLKPQFTNKSLLLGTKAASLLDLPDTPSKQRPLSPNRRPVTPTTFSRFMVNETYS